MNMGGEYQYMRKILRIMDEKQLNELFHDLDDIDAVERIANAAYDYLEQYNLALNKEKQSEYEDWKAQDDAQRNRDHKIDNQRPY